MWEANMKITEQADNPIGTLSNGFHKSLHLNSTIKTTNMYSTHSRENSLTYLIFFLSTLNKIKK